MREIQDIHEPFAAWLKKAFIPFHRNRTDKKTTATLGDPDFLLTYMNRCLYIECKVPGNVLSDEQASRIMYLRAAGNNVVIAHSLDECIDACKKYLFDDITNLRMASASTLGAGKQVETVGTMEKHVTPHPQNSLSVLVQPTLDASQARESTTKRPTPTGVAERPANDGHSRGGQKLFIGRIGMIDWVMKGDGLPGSTAQRVRVASAADIINIR
jgi:hypothetical protein